MLCILTFAKQGHGLSRWHSFHQVRAEPRPHPCSSLWEKIVLLVLPEIMYKMKALVTIASKKIIAPFIIEVSDSSKPKTSIS